MVVRVADPDQSDALAARIDAMFANSPFETKTATERVLIKQFLDQVGNIGLILVSVTTAVFFTMLLVTANTMAQSVSERTNEIGVLKTLGFSGQSILTLVLLESLFLTFTGGLVGLGLAWLFAGGLGEAIKDYFPVFKLGTGTFIVGIALMLVFGLITGLWPALTAMRLKIVDALRRSEEKRMFRWLPIVWANLKRRKLRLVFTFISILLAFLMFGMLDALRTSLAGVVNVVGADRLLVQSKVNMIVPLPRAHYEKIRATKGVQAAASFNWFGGMYKDAKQHIQMQATDPEHSWRCIPS